MKLVLGRARGGAALAFGAWVGIGCTDEQTGFFIRGNVYLDAPECIARAESDSTLLISGVLDVAIKPDYEASLLVGSQLTPRGDKNNLRTETMITTVTGAEVHLYDDTGALDGEPYTVPATGVIIPDGSDEAGFGIITATLVPAATGVAIADELGNRAEVRTRVAEVSIFGKTIGGLEIESAPFSYVIRVCEGCLIDFPAAAFDPTSAIGCFSSSDETITPPCRTGQDEVVDCRICSGGNSYCQFPGGIAPTP
jgi:hypothetical protein